MPGFYKHLAFHLILDRSDCIDSPPVNGLRKVTGVVGRVVDLGVVSMIDAAVGGIHLFILSISLIEHVDLNNKINKPLCI